MTRLCWHLFRLRGTWGAGPSFHAEELYSHANDTGADHDAFENENVAASAQRRLEDCTALLANSDRRRCVGRATRRTRR